MERELAKKEKFNKKPDLLLIDGGKGQLSAVVEVLEELDMTGLPLAGLAKEHEWLYLPDQSDPIVLLANSAALHLVARVRDEAHRFAVTYHRQRRAKSMTSSLLDEPDERMELFNRLAAVPVRSATVGGGAQRLDMPHIAGAARTTGNGAPNR